MKNVLVIGDTIIDNYSLGTVSRISPEAPVPVFDFVSSEKRLGGACNVCANIKSLASERVKIDYFGFNDFFVKISLENNQIQCVGVPHSSNEILTKTRFVCDKHQLLRLDNCKKYNDESCLISEKLFKKVDLSHYDIIVVSDYDKGTLTDETWQHLASFQNTIILADIKRYRGIFAALNFSNFVLKCNLKEWESNFSFSNLKTKDVVVTLGENGYKILSTGKTYPALNLQNDIVDVTGAGDVFLAAMCINFAEKGFNIEEMCRFANIACAEKVKRFGTVEVHRGWIK